MPTVALSGNDTHVINGRVLQDFGDGNVAYLTFPNNVAAIKTGKNGNSLYALNTTGFQANLKYRILRGSADDQFFNNLYNLSYAPGQNFAATVLMQGAFVKNMGDGTGFIIQDTYTVIGGIFVKAPEALTNPEGSNEQNLTMWEIMFSNTSRVIG